jgi:hypothetical protein
MSKTFYARLQLMIDGKSTIPDDPKGIFSPTFLQRYTYKLKIAPKPGLQITNGAKSFSGNFNKLRSADHEFKTEGVSLDTLPEVNAKFDVTWEIYFDGKLNHSVAGKLFDQSRVASKDWFRFDIRFTKANTKWSTTGETNVVTQAVSSGVGWYLVKKEEAFGDLMKRAFIKPSQINWDVMKEVNVHLGNLTTMTMLKPGQVVIVSKTKGSSNPKLQKMKTAAVKAQAAWKEAIADGKIDTTEMALIDLLINGHELIPINADDIEGMSSQKLANGLRLSDDYKPYVDGMIGLTLTNFDQVSKAQQALAGVANDINYTNEKGTIKRATRSAAQKHNKPFRLLNDSKFARQLVYWDTGIKANRARDYISAAVQLRSANLNGGIDSAAENLKKVGRISKVLRGAGYVGIAIDGVSSGLKARDAYSKGDTKGGNIEVGKGAGSIVGGLAGGALAGAVVGYLVFGVVTGGVGLVVVGVAAAAAGYGSGKVGEAVGERGAKKFNEVAF